MSRRPLIAGGSRECWLNGGRCPLVVCSHLTLWLLRPRRPKDRSLALQYQYAHQPSAASRLASSAGAAPGQQHRTSPHPPLFCWGGVFVEQHILMFSISAVARGHTLCVTAGPPQTNGAGVPVSGVHCASRVSRRLKSPPKSAVWTTT